MGCDFFYDGNLPEIRLQEKVMNFVKDFFRKIDLEITPETSRTYSTEFHLPSVGLKYDPRTERHEEYSFNFYGIIPDCRSEDGICDAGQFIFNRNDNGRLVKIRRLPDSYEILPHRYFQEEDGSKEIINDNLRVQIPGRVVIPLNKGIIEPRSHQVEKPRFQIVVYDGGYIRVGGGLAFALLLTICKLRWWPDLKMGDDYENCEIVDALLAKYGLHQQILDENLDFNACHNLFISEYNKDFPSPS